jgi:hypothetical protein
MLQCCTILLWPWSMQFGDGCYNTAPFDSCYNSSIWLLLQHSSIWRLLQHSCIWRLLQHSTIWRLLQHSSIWLLLQRSSIWRLVPHSYIFSLLRDSATDPKHSLFAHDLVSHITKLGKRVREGEEWRCSHKLLRAERTRRRKARVKLCDLSTTKYQRFVTGYLNSV